MYQSSMCHYPRILRRFPKVYPVWPWSSFSPPNVECGDLSPFSEPCGDESPHSTNSPIGLNDDQGPPFSAILILNKAGPAILILVRTSSFRQGLPESRCHGRQLDARKCLIQVICQSAVSHPCGLDSGNPCRNDGSQHRFVKNENC